VALTVANDGAMHSRPSRFAIASTVAESSPPDSKTTAFIAAVC
jgi:hypothetical protein